MTDEQIEQLAQRVARIILDQLHEGLKGGHAFFPKCSSYPAQVHLLHALLKPMSQQKLDALFQNRVPWSSVNSLLICSPLFPMGYSFNRFSSGWTKFRIWISHRD